MVASQKIAKNIFRIVLTACVFVVGALLIGCDREADIKLLRSEISIYVGESRNILPYVGFLPAVETGDVTLSTQSDVVSVDGTTVLGLKTGSAEITVSAHGKTATMRVDVGYKHVVDFDVVAQNAIQTADGTPKTVLFSAVFDGEFDPDTTAVWQVDGKTHKGNSFEYTPKGYGEYAVDVSVGNVKKSSAVRVYRRTNVTVKHTELYNVSTYLPMEFSAHEAVNSLNPKSVYDWRVNGESAGDGTIFSFTPKFGKNRVSLYVNGECKKIDGKDELVFDVEDDFRADVFVDYDDVNGVYVRWHRDRKVMYVSVTDPDNNRMTFDVTDAQYAHLFDSGSFRATEYIELCASKPDVYTIIIGTESGPIEFNFLQLGDDVKEYIDGKVFINNSFISNDSQAREWVWEVYATGQTEAKCFVPFGAAVIEPAVREQAEMLGLTADIQTNGAVLFLTLLPYANKPTDLESKTVNSVYAQLPHIIYDGERRDNDYVFMSDRSADGVDVYGTEQLLVAVSNGVKPITQKNDIADGVYKTAKSILLRIIGKDYTPRQKVHAVYDWLQRVSANISNAGPNSTSRFLEGIFAVTRGNAANSEGTAKAVALLCGMEGIDCVICYDKEYGYYNKVMLDGLWYNVDVFGGKVSFNTPTGAAVELASHRGLLISDAQLKNLGCKELPVDKEAFDTTNTEFMQKYSYKGVYFGYYIDRTAISYDAVRAAVYYAFDGTVRGNITLPYVGSEVHIFNNTYGAEFELDDLMTMEQVETVIKYINKAVDEYAKDVLNAKFANWQTRVEGNTIAVIADSPRPQTE